MRRRSRLGVAGGTLALAVTLAGTAGCGSSRPSAGQTVSAFVSAWNSGDTTAMAKLTDHPAPTFSGDVQQLTAGLGAGPGSHKAGMPTVQGSRAAASMTTTYHLPGLGNWTTSSTLPLVRRSGRWLVEWSPSIVDPALSGGTRLLVAHTWPPRAPILGAGGSPLTTQQAQVVVGVEGSRIKDPAQLTQLLETAGATPVEVQAALAAAAAHPTFFEAVMTISQARYEQLGGNQGALHGAAGTVFQHISQRAAVTPGLAAHIVGSVGPITSEELKRLGPPYSASSIIGQSGLEAAYEKTLAGSPGGTVQVTDPAGRAVKTLYTFPPKPGTSVTVSIDPGVQAAAESAVANLTGPAALVAVQVSSGKVLADVSLPATSQFDLGLAGALPPGSTFKVLTATALFESGLTPASPTACPPGATVDGKAFHNAEGDSPVSTVLQAFAESCNTAFVQLAAAHLQAASFSGVAALYGIGTAFDMGLPAFSGKVPPPSDGAALAATAIGQGEVVVSPLDMAMVAAAVGSGEARPPLLVTGAPDDTAAPRPLPAGIAAELRQMMAAVAATGTAAGTGLPAGTFAKTGTAEYGSGDPLPTDAWLIGYHGDVAFAMVVQDSHGNGGPVDGPVIARFLDSLPAAWR